jgi:hypothetical protein
VFTFRTILLVVEAIYSVVEVHFETVIIGEMKKVIVQF